jgi:transposase InsO family protein
MDERIKKVIFNLQRNNMAGYFVENQEELLQLNRYVLIDRKWHCPPGEEFAKKFGFHYWVKSSAEINWKFQRNICFLEDYLLDSETEVLSEAEELIFEDVQREPGILLVNLLKAPEIKSDDVYYMIARKKIYVDIEDELLTEPERTHVFADEHTSLAYKVINSTQNNAMLKTHSLPVAPGAKVLWDGCPWTIANLGDENISLVSNGNITELSRKTFTNLVCEQRIKGVESELLEYHTCLIKSIFDGASEKDLEVANTRYQMILPILEGGKKRELTDIKVTPRTIRNWCNSYRQAEQEYGSGYIGLIPQVKNRGNRTERLSREMLKDFDDFFRNNETPVNQKHKVLYGKLQEICKQKGYIIPSFTTFRKKIRQRPRKEQVYNTLGSRVGYNTADDFYWELDMTTPRHGERPFEIAHIDHTEVDLQTVHSVTGRKMGKFWLTLMVDAFSRRILAFYITFDPPSYRSNMMVLRECVRRFNRLPQAIVTDNGRDFIGTYFQSLLARYNVTLKIRPPHESRNGSICERMFGTSNTQLFHNLVGNSKIMKNVRQVTKSVNPSKHAVWTLPALYDLCKEYFYEFYDTSEHSTFGESPREVFERGMAFAGKRKFRIIPYNDDFLMMTLPKIKSGTSKVDPQRGIKARYLYYYCEDFKKPDVAGSNVPVRYDPWDGGVVYAFVRGIWVKCYSEYYSIFKGRSEQEIRIATEELMKQKENNSKKFNISARELGEFILKAEDSEVLLAQQLADSEVEPQLKVINGGFCTDKSHYVYSQEQVEDELEFDLNDISFNFEAEFKD